MSGQVRVVENFSNQSRKGNVVANVNPSPVVMKTPVDSKSVMLSDTWVLWSHRINDDNWNLSSYSKLCEIAREDAVEWLTKNFPASEEHIFYLMRKGIVPIWEDPKNRNGGCFSYKISRRFYKEIWSDSCKALIFDYLINDIVFSETITGISINPRTNTLKIWNSNKSHNQQNYIHPCIKGVDFKSCMYKPHQIDESRKVETGFRGSNETVDSSNSEEQKITIMLQRITALMSKLVKSNLNEFTLKLKKMEELFGENDIIKAFDRYEFINSQNDNEYLYIKLKLRLIYGLKCRNKIYRMVFEKIINRYYEIMNQFKTDDDLTPKNISELEQENASEEEIDRNIYVTSLRNEVKCICVAFYYYCHINLLEDGKDFWTPIIDKTLGKYNEFSDELTSYNPYLVFDGILRLIIMIKPKLTPAVLDKLQQYKTDVGNVASRKIRFTIDDVCKYLNDGVKSPAIIELHEVFTD